MSTEDTAKINTDISLASQAIGLIRRMERELAEMKSAYMDVSAHNAKLAKQLIALRIAVRELTGPTEGPQEVPQPEGSPEKTFEERRGHTCGCDVSVTMMREEDVPEEVKQIIVHLIRSL